MDNTNRPLTPRDLLFLLVALLISAFFAATSWGLSDGSWGHLLLLLSPLFLATSILLGERLHREPNIPLFVAGLFGPHSAAQGRDIIKG